MFYPEKCFIIVFLNSEKQRGHVGEASPGQVIWRTLEALRFPDMSLSEVYLAFKTGYYCGCRHLKR